MSGDPWAWTDTFSRTDSVPLGDRRHLRQPEPGPEPACPACGNTGVIVTADHRGDPSEEACAYCDTPYPVTGDPDAEDPWGEPAETEKENDR